MALGSTQPVTEVSTRKIPWSIKAAGSKADKLTTFMCCLPTTSGSLSLLESSWPVQACTGIALILSTLPTISANYYYNNLSLVHQSLLVLYTSYMNCNLYDKSDITKYEGYEKN